MPHVRRHALTDLKKAELAARLFRDRQGDRLASLQLSQQNVPGRGINLPARAATAAQRLDLRRRNGNAMTESATSTRAGRVMARS